MIEIRLHGRGGQGVVKASEIIVESAFLDDIHGQFIPFFGVERKGSPVFGNLRLNNKEIRRKNLITNPDIVIIFDDTLVKNGQPYLGIKDKGIVIINTKKSISELNVPSNVELVVSVDANKISNECISKNIPNTCMIGAFQAATNLVSKESTLKVIEKVFDKKNRKAAIQAMKEINILRGKI